MKSDTVEEAIKILKDLRYLPTVKWTYKIIMIIKYIKVRDKNIFWFKIYLMRYAENENRKKQCENVIIHISYKDFLKLKK